MRETEPLIQETLVTEELPSGLRVSVIPRRGQRRTYATFATYYGSIDSHFRLPESGQTVDVPDGIAHFLEHKLFEKPDGDVMSDFSRLGASTNAYTEYLTTTYLFSTTEHREKCLEILLNFVQDPYFTPENVEKEKGIIEQEIRMYLDMPGDRLHSNLMRALYVRHPVRLDIAGSVESIRQITPEELYQCYRTFYHPSNMWVFVDGDVDPDRVIAAVFENQAGRDYKRQPPIPRILPEEPPTIHQERIAQRMPVALPMLAIGYKDPVENLSGPALARRELVTDLMWSLAIGRSSALFFELYEAGLINDRFGAQFEAAPSYAYSVLSGETRDPDALLERIERGLQKVHFDEKALERHKRRHRGQYLALFNNPGQLAYAYNSFYVRQVDLFHYLEDLDGITLAAIEERFHEHVRADRRALSLIEPEDAKR